MAASVLTKMCSPTRFLARSYASTALATSLSEAINYSSGDPAHLQTRKPVEPVQVTKLPNGITVASQDGHGPCSTVSVYIRSGARAEQYNELGLTHLIRNSAFFSTKNKTGLSVLREVDKLGGVLSATSTRENMIYTSQFLRGNEEKVLEILGSVVTSPALHSWEIRDECKRLVFDHFVAYCDASTKVMEEVHKLAFRSGLSNSIYCSPENAQKFTNENVKDFIINWYIGQNVIVSGVDIDHNNLVDLTKSSFSAIPERIQSQIEPSSYVGGCETRYDTTSQLAHVAVVCKGAGFSSGAKTIACAGVLQHLLGAGPYIKWSSNTVSSRLTAGYTSNEPCVVNAININYSDNGLFGIYTISDGSIMDKVLKVAMNNFAQVVKGQITPEELSRAKEQYKAACVIELESNLGIVDNIAQQVANTGNHSNDTINVIDSITKEDVIKFATGVFGTRPCVVAHGNLSTTPRMDQLLSRLT